MGRQSHDPWTLGDGDAGDFWLASGQGNCAWRTTVIHKVFRCSSMFDENSQCTVKSDTCYSKTCEGTLQRSANHRSCMHIQITFHQIPGQKKNSCAISSTQAPTLYISKNSCNSHTDFTQPLCHLEVIF